MVGMAVGAVVGSALSMVVNDNFRGTKKKLRKNAQKAMRTVTNVVEGITSGM